MTLVSKTHNNRHIIGLLLLLFSFAPFFTENRGAFLLTICFGSYCLGIAFIADYISYRVTGSSYLSRILERHGPRSHFFMIALVGGLIMEGLSTYLAGLWVYPYYSLSTYFIIAVLLKGFGWYFLCIVLSYEAVKDTLDYFFKSRVVTKSFKNEHYIYPGLLVVGSFGLMVVIVSVLVSTSFFTNFHLNVNAYKVPYLKFSYLCIGAISILFILEYIEYAKKQTSLLKDTFHGYLNPLLAIVISSFVLAFYMESQNVPLGLWVYTNWPYQNITILSVPLFAYLFWPLHYIFILSLYRSFGGSSSSRIWSPASAVHKQ